MADLAIFGVEIDASGAKRGADQVASAAKQSESALERLERQTAKTQAQLNDFGRTKIKDPGFASAVKNLDREIASKIKDIDRQLDALEKSGTKAARGMDDFGKSTGRARSSAGQFIEALAQGDPGELLGEIAQNGGRAGVAIAGLAIGFAVAAVGIVAMTGRMIELVRETELLAKNSKLTATQIQGLQVVANLTGESVEDLAENYKKLGPEVKRFEELVKSSGAAIDGDLRDKTQRASMEWELFKLTAQGALNDIARESLPAVTSLLREMNALIRDGSSAWSAFGNFGAGVLGALTTMLRQFRTNWAAIIADLPQMMTPGGAAAAGASIALRDTQGIVGDFKLNNQSAFPKVPGLKKAGGGGASSAEAEAKALFEAQIALERSQSKILLEEEKRRIVAQRDLIETDYENRILSAKDFFAEKILLQQQEAVAEIRHQESLLAIVERQQARAKKPSEKLAFEDDLANIRDTIQKLSTESGRATTKLGQEAFDAMEKGAKAARALFSDYAATVRELALAYNELESGSQATVTERFKDQYKAVYDLMKLVSPAQAKELQNLLGLIQGKQQSTNDFNQAGKRFDNMDESLALEEDRIRVAVEQRTISEGRGMDLLKKVRGEYRDGLLEEIDLMIALKSAQPDTEQEVIRLQRKRLEVEQYGKELSAVEARLRQFGDDAKNILQDAFYQGIVEGPRAFFQTLLQGFSQLLARLASELLTSQFVKLLGNLGQGATSSGGGGFWSTLLNFGLKFAGALAGGAISGAVAGAGISGVGSILGGSGGFISGGAGAGFASGTDYVSRAGMYNVGELGPERVFLPQGAAVQNNYEMRQQSGDQRPINIVVNVTGVQNPAQFKQNSSQIGAQISQALLAHQRTQ